MATKKVSAYQRIRQAMRDREAEVLEYVRNEFVSSTMGFSMQWHNALDRLEAAGMVSWKRGRNRYHSGRYVARKYARPVTRVA